MSAATQANKDNYVKLLRDFAASRIDEKTFQTEFLTMRRRDLEQDEVKTRTWLERYDVKLQEDLQRGYISLEEFSKKWHDLWGYQPTKWLNVFDRLFRDIDRFEWNDAIYRASKEDPDPYNADYCITEADLRDRILKYLLEFESD